jgi:acetoin utilization protein AcuC
MRYLINKGLWVAYLDIDVHHGDGVQEILYNEEHVLTISLHESGQFLFPGTGEIHELGTGAGRGMKLNIPLQPYTEGESYLEVFEKVLPAALQRFGPGVLLVQAGADAHYSDPLADLMLTTRDYERIFRCILEYADRYANGRVIFTLGGGYSLVAVPRVWAILYLLINDLPIVRDLPADWVLKWSQRLGQKLPSTLHDPNPGYPELPQRPEIARHNRREADRLLEATSRFWY